MERTPYYPRRKGKDEDEFIKQVDYLRENYSLVTNDEVADYVTKGTALPERACHLTFDDGFVEHYSIVFPILSDRRINATFFPPSAPVLEDKLLDVHNTNSS